MKRKIYSWMGLFVVCAGMLAFASTAHAAKSVTVGDEGAKVYLSPDDSGKAVQSLSGGETIRVSDQATDGWYKVLLKKPVKGKKIGYVQEDKIAPPSGDESEPGAEKKSTHKKASRKSSVHLIEATGFYHFLPGGAGAQLAYGISPEFWLALRTTLMSLKADVTSAVATYQLTGRDISVMAYYAVVAEPAYTVRLGAGPTMGFGLKLANKSNSADSSGTFSAIGATLMAAGRYWVMPQLGIDLELGMRTLTKSGVTIGTKVADLSVYTPLVGLGLTYGL